VLVDNIPCNSNGKIDIYRITRDRLQGEAYNILPVRENGRLTDIDAEPAGQLDSIRGGTLPEGMEGRSALGMYDLFNQAPETKKPADGLFEILARARKTLENRAAIQSQTQRRR
jgi:hypothetical protein